MFLYMKGERRWIQSYYHVFNLHQRRCFILSLYRCLSALSFSSDHGNDVRSKKDEQYKKMAKFWGHLFLINFAVGVVTGILQEFQFGMNWSEYSRFVGDVFGAPLAIEALLAFLWSPLSLDCGFSGGIVCLNGCTVYVFGLLV